MAYLLLLKANVELVGGPVVQWRSFGREVDRDVFAFAGFPAEGTAHDAVDTVAVPEVFGESLADQLLGGLEVRLVSFMLTFSRCD